MNTIVLNILSNNNLAVDRESFQEEFKECLFYGIMNKGEVDENIKISSIFGMKTPERFAGCVLSTPGKLMWMYL